MALIVEDGTLPVGSNSYISLADADAYLVPRGLWPDSAGDATIIAAKETALLRAADYLNTLQWYGQPVTWDRTMAWPRVNVPLPGSSDVDEMIAETVVPKSVAQAQAELAALVYAGTNPLAAAERGGRVVAESHTTKEGGIDVIGGDSQSDSYTYADSAPIETYFPAVSGLLRALLAVIPGRSGARMVEAGRG